MAAPLEAYVNYKYNTITSASTLVQHSLAIPTDDATTLKNRFYLDKLYQVQTSSGTTFIGGCKVGSFNYQHHNTNRVGALRSRAEDESEVVYFADAGLNTLGDALTTSASIVNYANYIVIPSKFTSAYYSDSTRVFWQVRKRDTTNWLEVDEEVLPKKTTRTANSVLIWPIPIFDDFDLIELRPCIQNEEGIFYGPLRNVGLSRKIEIYPVFFVGATSGCSGGTAVNIIMDYTHNYLFSSVDNTTGDLIPATSGWYHGYFNLPKKESIRINSDGLIINRSDCGLPPDPIKDLTAGAGLAFTAPGQPQKWSASVSVTGDGVTITATTTVTLTAVVKNSSGTIIQSRNITLILYAGDDVAFSPNYSIPTGGVSFSVTAASNDKGFTMSYS